MNRLPTIAGLCALVALGVTITSEMTAPSSPVSRPLVAQAYDTPAPSPSPEASSTPGAVR